MEQIETCNTDTTDLVEAYSYVKDEYQGNFWANHIA